MERYFPNLDAEDRRRKARHWLREECLWSGVLEEGAGGRLRFWHLTFEEYLAALQLAWRRDGEDDPEMDWWPSVRDQAAKSKALAAHQLSVLFSAGDPDRTSAAPDWRPVGPRS